jgi:hypothetical protein
MSIREFLEIFIKIRFASDLEHLDFLHREFTRAGEDFRSTMLLRTWAMARLNSYTNGTVSLCVAVPVHADVI